MQTGRKVLYMCIARNFCTRNRFDKFYHLQEWILGESGGRCFKHPPRALSLDCLKVEGSLSQTLCPELATALDTVPVGATSPSNIPVSIDI